MPENEYDETVPPGTNQAAGILQPQYFLKLYEIQKSLEQTVSSMGDTLDALCYKPVPGQACFTASPLDYFRQDETTIRNLTPETIQAYIGCNVVNKTVVPCFTTLGIPVQEAVVLGNLSCQHGSNSTVCGGCSLKRTNAMMLTVLLNARPELVERAKAWEKDVFIPIVQSISIPGVITSFLSERSISDQLEIVEEQNRFVVIVSYAAMFVYIAVALGKFPHPVATRMGLSLQGIAIVGLSVGAALGIVTLAGMSITMIVTEVVPFLILAIGVDNMFIIVRNMDKVWWGPLGPLMQKKMKSIANSSSSGHHKMKLELNLFPSSLTCGVSADKAIEDALVKVGPTITAAALCEVAAFLVGITLNIPALKQFCIVATIAVAVDYLLQITWFIAAVILDARRQEKRRLDCAPCMRLRGTREEANGNEGFWRRYVRFASDSSNDNILIERKMQASSTSEDGVLAADAESNTPFDSSVAPEGNIVDNPIFQGHGALELTSPRGTFTYGDFLNYPRTGSANYAQMGMDEGLQTGYASKSALDRLQEKLAESETTYTNQEDDERTIDYPQFSGNGNMDDDMDAPLLESQNDGLHTTESNSDTEIILRDVHKEIGSVYLLGDDRFKGVDGESPKFMSSRFLWVFFNHGNFSKRFLDTVYSPFLFSKPVRMIVIALWIVALAVSIFGLTRLELGLEQQLVLPTGSYLAPYFQNLAKYGNAGPPAYIVLQNVDYTHPDISDSFSNLVNAVQDLHEVIVPPVASWYFDYLQYANCDSSICPSKCPKPLPIKEPFAKRVSQFIYDIPINTPCCQSVGMCGGQYATDIKFLWGLPKEDQNARKSMRAVQNALLSNSKNLTALLDFTSTIEVSGGVSHTLTRKGYNSYIHDTGKTGYLSATRLQIEQSEHEFVRSNFAFRRSLEGEDQLVEEDIIIDDGGCDVSSGFLMQREVEAILKHMNGGNEAIEGLGSSVHLRPHSVVNVLGPKNARILTNSDNFAANSLLMHLQESEEQGLNPMEYLDLGLLDDSVKLVPCHVMTSRLRAQHTPLRTQKDFIDAKQILDSVVNILQNDLPTLDLEKIGVKGYGPLVPGVIIPDMDDIRGHTQWLPPAPGGLAFPYSLIYVFYEQYDFIRGVAMSNVLCAIGAVFLASFVVSHPSVAGMTSLLVSSAVITLCGWVWLFNPHGERGDGANEKFGVDLNAVSVVNLITSVGLSVEFMIHIAAAFVSATKTVKQGIKRAEVNAKLKPLQLDAFLIHGEPVKLPAVNDDVLKSPTNMQIARSALVEMGASVVTGITLTKFVGVVILAWAPSELFRLYYFRMYLGIVVVGAFHGLALLPVLLATFGLPT